MYNYVTKLRWLFWSDLVCSFTRRIDDYSELSSRCVVVVDVVVVVVFATRPLLDITLKSIVLDS